MFIIYFVMLHFRWHLPAVYQRNVWHVPGLCQLQKLGLCSSQLHSCRVRYDPKEPRMIRALTDVRVTCALVLSLSGGLHHAAVRIAGEKVYRHLKLEGGTHRVQRIPEVGLSSRRQCIHTGTMTVIILPQPTKVLRLCRFLHFCFCLLGTAALLCTWKGSCSSVIGNAARTAIRLFYQSNQKNTPWCALLFLIGVSSSHGDVICK